MRRILLENYEVVFRQVNKGETETETIYNSLFSYFGPRNWWQAKTPFEMIVGAILRRPYPGKCTKGH